MPDAIMAVDRLYDIPRPPLPAGLTLRPCRPGGAAAWTQIHKGTGFYDPFPLGLHEREFGQNDASLAERQLFVVDANGREVVTATAWINDPAHGLPGGRRH